MTKTKQKAKYNEDKRRVKEVWMTEMESNEKNQESNEENYDTMSVPSHFKRYTI